MKKLIFSLLACTFITCVSVRAEEAATVEAPVAEKTEVQDNSVENAFWKALNDVYAEKFNETHHTIEVELQKAAEAQGVLFTQMIEKYGQEITNKDGKKVIALAVPVLFVLTAPDAQQ